MTTTHKVMKRERVGSIEVEYTVTQGYRPQSFVMYMVRAYKMHVWDHQHGNAMRGEPVFTRMAVDIDDGYVKFDELRNLAASHQLAEALGLSTKGPKDVGE